MQTTTKEPKNTTKATQRDLYREVTDKIIGMLEKGVAPWKRTWSTYGLARNYATGHVYTGINLILMNNTEHLIPYFMTFNQIKERGGQVRKGVKAEMVIYFSVFYKTADDQTLTKEEAQEHFLQGEEIQVLKFIKYFNVFNVADIEGIEFQFSEVELKPNEKIERCEQILWEMPTYPEIKNMKSKGPFYDPIADYVNVPPIEQFESGETYYASLFHELIHATGHGSRLGREEVMNPQKFGSQPYSREELVAEMGTSFLCSTVQIDYDGVTENSASYLQGWLNVLKADSRFIFKAAAEAQKAADYILNRRMENDCNPI